MHFTTLISGFLCASVAFSRPTAQTDALVPLEGGSTTPSADSLTTAFPSKRGSGFGEPQEPKKPKKTTKSTITTTTKHAKSTTTATTTTKPAKSTTTTTTTSKQTQCSPLGISPSAKKAVVNQFATDQIVPDLIERINPTVQVNVTYHNTDVGDKSVYLGTYFTTAETINAPTLTFSGEKDYDPYTTLYTYFLVDPDVPQDGSPVQVSYEHWNVYNASPSCAPDNSQTAVIYQALSPASTTQHRYTFLVYRQPPGYVPDIVSLQLRTPFDINDYAQDHNLTLVGGNFLKEAITNGLQDGAGAIPTGLTTTGS